MSFKIITIEELIKMLDKYNHKELHIHHTYIPNHSHFNGSNGIQLQINMRNYHVNVNKWSDIAQHISLLPSGEIVTGRDFGSDPASIRGYNAGAFCVEMIGNFDIGKDRLEGKQKDSMLRLSKYFYDKGKYIRFHRENAPKTCPGTSIDKSEFMNEVKNYGNAPQVTQPTKSQATSNVIFEGKTVEAININGTTQVWTRHLSNLLGVSVSFANGQVILNSKAVPKNEVLLMGGKSYMHTRVIADRLGLKIHWNNITKTVTLSK